MTQLKNWNAITDNTNACLITNLNNNQPNKPKTVIEKKICNNKDNQTGYIIKSMLGYPFV